MKIRWTAESVRFRITPSELAVLKRGETVREMLLWGEDTAWSAEIVPQPGATAISLRPGSVRVTLSAEDRVRLSAPYAEGIYFEREGDPPLRYYIEKDFPCAHPRSDETNEPMHETFESPAGFEERKTMSGPIG